jgi:predicted mannosyl-3-phosphoglycerate phosphatase (HAD superfamily)
MNWNPYKRIDDLERRVNEMHHEMLHVVASTSARVRMLEQKMGRNTVLADFKDETVQTSGGLPTELLTLEQTQALIDKRVRVNAIARKAYAKKKRLQAKAAAVQS